MTWPSCGLPAGWLSAGKPQLGELRQRADAGNDHALDQLAAWLATHHLFDELRKLISAGRGRAAQLLSSWQGWPGDMELVRVFADMGDDDARPQLARWLASARARERRRRPCPATAG